MVAQNTNSLPLRRMFLPLTAVLIQCLDKDCQEIAGCTASGFIRVENEKAYLYTCWHVVTGFDPKNIQTGNSLPDRQYVKVLMQNYDIDHIGLGRLGGSQTITLPLYDFDFSPPVPIWHQEITETECFELNEINIRVPKKYDVIKLELPSDISLSSMQVIREDQSVLITGPDPLISVGKKVYVVGFPYGYSSSGLEKPTAIALTRFIATSEFFQSGSPTLLDSIGAPGMSGGPVFVERNDQIRLFGIYTGSIYPDFSNPRDDRNIRSTDLGKIQDLSMIFDGVHWPMVRQFDYIQQV